MRVAAVQFEAGEDVGENLATTLRMIDAAAERGAELIVLPEFCNHLSWYEDRVTAHETACRLDGPFLAAVAGRAIRHAAYIKINVTVAREDGRTTGTSLLYGPDGALLGQSDKLTLMGAEGDHLDPGTQAGPIVATPDARLGMYACMEGVTSDVPRELAVRGAQVLLNSLNSFATDEASLHIPVRAAENKVWVVAANKVGPLLPRALLPAIGERLGVPPEWLHGAGESQIVAPDGSVVAKAPRTGEAVVVADIDPARADDKLRPDGTHVMAARTPAAYGPIAARPVPRAAPPGAEAVRVAVVTGGDPAVMTAAAARDGALLIVLPHLAFHDATFDATFDATSDDTGDATAHDAADDTAVRLAAALAGTTAYAVTGVPGGAAILVNAGGLVAVQDGPAPAVHGLPWGGLALVPAAYAVHPESFRLAAIADADAVAVPLLPGEPWELALGLPERSAENRLNVVAAGPGAGLILALPADFTLWTPWEGPFTGRISHPIVTETEEALTAGTIHPAQAVNRHVSKNTDLVGGRAWWALGALTQDPAPAVPEPEGTTR